MAIKKSSKSSSSSKTSADINEQIRKKAYELWEKRGRPSGNSMKDWLEAERIIKKKSI
ncbi:MAG: DUF2934 domain-containing protein [Candidatus Omnitrophota bacterium]|jgi:hypothetical protein